MTANDLMALLDAKRWWRRSYPFTHYWACNVFVREFYKTLEAAFLSISERRTSDTNDPDCFSRNMKYSDAYSWNFPPDLNGPLDVFYSRPWHDLLTGLTGVKATLDVNGALHHHSVGSLNGTVHRDLAVGWFSNQPRADGVNPMDLRRCSYMYGETLEPGVEVRETIRAVTMIFYLANPPWLAGQGGETGLYACADDSVERPSARIPPANNSIVVFENTPGSYHSFLRNHRAVRNSAILWLHRQKEEVLERWGNHQIARW
ncbi:MAG: 2OG-Fe(II) oxygenase [Candidatus Competibacteraceae bacterium]|nr:2OG-Fe(II) oxygenase [Candidatus Competibacteraceae bacterium]